MLQQGFYPKSARKLQGQIAGLSNVDVRYWRVGFSTRTSNREPAVKVAARICAHIVELGIQGALDKHRSTVSDQIAAIGQYLQVVLPRMGSQASSTSSGVGLFRRGLGRLRRCICRREKPSSDLQERERKPCVLE